MEAPTQSYLRPTESALDAARRELSQGLGGSRLITEPSACESYRYDESGFEGELPAMVACVSSMDDVLRVLEVAGKHGVPVTPRAAGTGKTGGALPVHGGIVLSLAGMNRIKEIDREQGIAVVEPGVILADFQRTVEAEGLFYPPDPNSYETCTLGGNVAENAAGPRAFKYGATRDYTIGLDVALMGGQRLSLGRRTRKGVTGYDLTSLFVGSEGTLGVVGDITLKLIPKPPHVLMLMSLFPNVRVAADAVAKLGVSGVFPRLIEILDGQTLDAMRAAGHSFAANAEAVLFIEFDGDETYCLNQAEVTYEVSMKAGAVDVLVAQDAAQRDRLWATRREMSLSIKKLTKRKLSEDIVVPRTKMSELLARVERATEKERVRWLAYGHAGDGNLHVNYLWNEPEEKPAVERAIDQLFRDTLELGGTLSGEHGIGLTKQDYLALEQSEAVIDVQRRLKALFDPRELLNPGKIFPRRGHGSC
jgi:glycolate oxidase